MTRQSFSATDEELELATQILVSRGCDATDGVLQGDQAKEVFNRSALPFPTLRDIWSLANENGTGVLSKHEIVKAMRLIGWVQAGEMLSEKLLVVGMSFRLSTFNVGMFLICFFFFSFTTAGPLPTLDGITNRELKSTRKPDSPQIAVFPPISEDQLQEFRAVFWQAGPVNGLLNGALNRFTKNFNSSLQLCRGQGHGCLYDL